MDTPTDVKVFWTTLSGVKWTPASRESSTLTHQGGRLFLYGGLSHKAENEIISFDMNEFKWKVEDQVDDISYGRYGHARCQA